jgi:hypothetical protein
MRHNALITDRGEVIAPYYKSLVVRHAEVAQYLRCETKTSILLTAPPARRLRTRQPAAAEPGQPPPAEAMAEPEQLFAAAVAAAGEQL